MELGRNFVFVGTQVPIVVSEQEFLTLIKMKKQNRCCVIAERLKTHENIIHAWMNLSQDAGWHCHFQEFLPEFQSKISAIIYSST